MQDSHNSILEEDTIEEAIDETRKKFPPKVVLSPLAFRLMCVDFDRLLNGESSEYFQTTYKFLELSPHALIPIHGRVNVWPKQMLCGYLKNRRSREANILKAIEGGAKTLFDIVEDVYSDVDRRAWIPASANVRLHVDHLAQQNKLPKALSALFA
ncbi:unnamed protein product [Sphenostylis stenocarpa]|uniref:LACTB2 winged helix domain-containing protein n=1 Tax=Sphenostylis stenocarpa TaxID=92480 RepID=A0AA86W374_9FABA|nr:unnamed protein product [Sphenostylis stenocarpa]